MSNRCINLKERFGRLYRIDHDESYAAERASFRADEEVWLQIIPGARGHVFPWGGELLAASTNTSGATAKRLKAMPWATVRQNGSDGLTVVFTSDHLAEVAPLLGLRRRRQVSDQERARLIALGKRFGFQRTEDGFQSDSDERPCVPTPQVEQQDLPAHRPLLEVRTVPVVPRATDALLADARVGRTRTARRGEA